MKHFHLRMILVTAISIILLGGCASGTTKHASSVVDYLYPNVKEPRVAPGIPVLSLPLRVGIAFVPAGMSGRPERSSNGLKLFQWGGDFSLTEKRKTDLMQDVAKNFKKYPFVKNIEIIPSTYLAPGGSFANLDQIGAMLEVDVIVLLSYDQVQFTDQTVDFTYWTVSGPIVIPAQKNDTHTMLDAVVYDIQSRKLLFRAPGTSIVKGSSLLFDQSQEIRADGDRGISEAAQSMIANLDEQLALFRDKIKERPEEYKVVQTPQYIAKMNNNGYSKGGGGSIDALFLSFVIFFGILLLWDKKRHP